MAGAICTVLIIAFTAFVAYFQGYEDAHRDTMLYVGCAHFDRATGEYVEVEGCSAEPPL